MKTVSVIIPIIVISLMFGCNSRENAEESLIQEADIWTAAAFGDVTRVENLAENGTDINAKEPAGGGSPLIVAALYGQNGVVRLLLDRGAEMNLKNKEGSTALHVAAFFGQPEVVEVLLDKGADTGIRNNYGQTPLEIVSGEWDEKLEGLYKLVAGMWKLELDLERIKEARPQVETLIRQHTGG